VSRICPDSIDYGDLNFFCCLWISWHGTKASFLTCPAGLACPRAAESATKRYICFSFLAHMKFKLHKDLTALLVMGLVLLILFIFFR
jgi:hypothetical protein